MADQPLDATGLLRVEVVTSTAARQTQEWPLALSAGASVKDALVACGLDAEDTAFSASVWGRHVALQRKLRDGDRIEWCRALKVDPKVARRQRFASQGRRSAGLFARARPGAKSGY